MISIPDRQAAVALINEAVANGSRQCLACREVGSTLRPVERWVKDGVVVTDRRPTAVRRRPSNPLSGEERAAVLRVANEPRFASLPPTQIVPPLADEGRDLAAESSFYRLLRAENQRGHRGRARARHPRAVPRHCATRPHQLYAWDITDLPGPIQGMCCFLYLVLDVYSRKIVAHEVHAQASAAHAATLIEQAVHREGVPHGVLVVHQDNGSPMKGSTYLAKLADLGIRPSYSRPGVSDDNADAESLCRRCKYRPECPGACATLDETRQWMLRFTRWYHHEHKHRHLKFVSLAQRHRRDDAAIFAQRTAVYQQARANHPAHWSGNIRHWSLPNEVWLNRPTEERVLREAA